MKQREMARAVVLFSGGIDSTTCLAIARSQGYEIHALSFHYHQRHDVEVTAARRILQAMGLHNHLVLELPLDRIGGSSLTSDIPVPKDVPLDAMLERIPSTYVPARNTIFLSFALAWAEVLKAEAIFIGANVVDYSGYPDCRPEFIQAFETMANLAIRETVEGTMRIRIEAPLSRLTKAQIIEKGRGLGVDYGLTHSCYDPDGEGRACGRCDSCRLRRKGFLDLGVSDPTCYAPSHPSSGKETS
jgi:7-cyano-7-deazaguanine synthase